MIKADGTIGGKFLRDFLGLPIVIIDCGRDYLMFVHDDKKYESDDQFVKELGDEA